MTRDSPALQLFRNNLSDHAPENRSVAVRFVGGNRTASPSRKFTARDGYGARVSVELANGSVVREHRAGEGWRTQNSSTLLIGIGQAEHIQRLAVRWPSGAEQDLAGVPAGSLVIAFEDPAESSDGSGFDVTPYVRGTAPRRQVERAVVAATATGRLPLEASSRAKLSMFIAMATWCPACRHDLDHIRRLREQLSEESLAIFGVPTDLAEGRGVLRKYVEKNDPAYRLLSDLSLDERRSFNDFMLRELHTEVLPATVIVTQDGTPVHLSAGTPTLSEMRVLLERFTRHVPHSAQ